MRVVALAILAMMVIEADSQESGLPVAEDRKLNVTALDTLALQAEASLSLGSLRKLQGRVLSTSCEDDQTFCSGTCVDHTDDLNPTVCQAESKELKCVSQFDQIYVEGHGDYWLACTDSTTNAEPRPQVEQPTGECADWETESTDDLYDYSATLVADQTVFLWGISNGKLSGKMVHKGKVGWMAVGIPNTGGNRHGMNGAHVVMGRNLESGPTVKEYKIHDEKAEFRHWKDPLSPGALTDTEMVVSSCLSYIKFTTATIHGEALSLGEGASQKMIWALTYLDYPTDDFGGYSGYHTSSVDVVGDPKFRNHMHLDLAGGKQLEGGHDHSDHGDDDDDDDHGGHDHNHDHDGDTSNVAASFSSQNLSWKSTMGMAACLLLRL